MTADGQTGGVGTCLFYLLKNLTHAQWIMNHPCTGRGEFTQQEPDDTFHSQKQEADPGVQLISEGATRWYLHLSSPWMPASDPWAPGPLWPGGGTCCSGTGCGVALWVAEQGLCRKVPARLVPSILPCVHSCCHLNWVDSQCLPSPSSKAAWPYTFPAASSSCPLHISVWMLWLHPYRNRQGLDTAPKASSTHRYWWGWTKEVKDGQEDKGGGSETDLGNAEWDVEREGHKRKWQRWKRWGGKKRYKHSCLKAHWSCIEESPVSISGPACCCQLQSL